MHVSVLGWKAAQRCGRACQAAPGVESAGSVSLPSAPNPLALVRSSAELRSLWAENS